LDSPVAASAKQQPSAPGASERPAILHPRFKAGRSAVVLPQRPESSRPLQLMSQLGLGPLVLRQFRFQFVSALVKVVHLTLSPVTGAGAPRPTAPSAAAPSALEPPGRPPTPSSALPVSDCSARTSPSPPVSCSGPPPTADATGRGPVGSLQLKESPQLVCAAATCRNCVFGLELSLRLLQLLP